MVGILFWNTFKGAVGSMVRHIADKHNVDIVITAEDDRDIDSILPPAGGLATQDFEEIIYVPTNLRFFLRQGAGSLSQVADLKNRHSLREFVTASGSKLLIVAAHLPSKLHAKQFEQYFATRRLRDAIELAEYSLGHDKTMIIGDMNMSPYEPGMTAADGLHGVMTKQLALRRPRTYQGVKQSYFYNPMWSRMGDESLGPPGTHYYSPDGIESIYWHGFDQVLIRPSLIRTYEHGKLTVIDEVNSQALLKNSGITPSDHLPILIQLPI